MGVVCFAYGHAAGDYQDEVVTFREIGLVRDEDFVDSSLNFFRRASATITLSIGPLQISTLKSDINLAYASAHMRSWRG